MTLALLVFSSLTAASASAAPDLTPPKVIVGSHAPALTVSDWVKGTKVPAIEKGKIYVIEFWATWCGPCKTSMPHITELQAKYPNITFIGVAVYQPGASKAEKLKTVSDFVAASSDIGYRIAYDGDETMSADWMTDGDIAGIPTSFVIAGDGRIAHIGYPLDLDPVLEKVSAGTWDIQKESASYLLNWKAMKWQSVIDEPFYNQDYAKTLQLIDEFEKTPEAAAAHGYLAIVHFSSLLGMDEADKAYAFLEQELTLHWQDPTAMLDLGWALFSVETPQLRPDVLKRYLTQLEKLFINEPMVVSKNVCFYFLLIANGHSFFGDQVAAINAGELALKYVPPSYKEWVTEWLKRLKQHS